MRRVLFLAVCLVLAGSAERSLAQSSDSAGAFRCPVTAPNGARYDKEPAGGNHGNDALVTGLWPDGKVVFKPGGPGSVSEDGALGMKWPWWRLVQGSLTLQGRRLDAAAPPMRAHIPHGYGDTGFQATGLIFPTPGCWEVTGSVAEASLTFVTEVVKIGEGPTRVHQTP
jgi:hypothetical protein